MLVSSAFQFRSAPAHQYCTLVPPISAHQCCLSMLPIVAHRCCLSVPISAPYQCTPVPSVSAQQCLLSVPHINCLPTAHRRFTAASRLPCARARGITLALAQATRGHARPRLPCACPAIAAGDTRWLVTERGPGAVCVNTQLPVLSGGEMLIFCSYNV